MLMARINAPPRKARRIIGKFFRVEKPVQAGYSSLPPKDLPLMLTRHEAGTLTLQNGQSYCVGEASVLTSVLKTEAEKLRQEMRNKLTTCPVPPTKTSWYTGSDPEVFVVNGQGHVVPAFAFLRDKKQPQRLLDVPGWGPQGPLVFWDGFQAEFTLCKDGHHCHAQLADWVRYGLKGILDAALKIEPKARLTHQCVVETPLELLAQSPPEGVLLGCDPSRNAYTDTQNPRLQAINPSELPFRFAGFHVHIGCKSQSAVMYKRMVKMMDAITGVISVAVLRGLEDARRRQYYGLAGEYRVPKHGLEWRVLSSAVLVHPAVMHLMLDLARVSARLGGSNFGFLFDGTSDEVRDCLNNLDVGLAVRLIERNRRLINILLEAIYGTCAKKAWRLIQEGASACVSMDMHANWSLEGQSWIGHSNGDQATVHGVKL